MSLLRRLLFSHSIRVLFVACVLYTGAILYGRVYLYSTPGSIFFNPSRAFERHYSAYRELETKTWNNDAFHRLQLLQSGHNTSFQKSGTNPRICGVFITSKREDASQYIDVR